MSKIEEVFFWSACYALKDQSHIPAAERSIRQMKQDDPGENDLPLELAQLIH